MTRKQFLDRLFVFEELESLSEMLRQWYVISTPRAPDRGLIQHSTCAYAFARHDRERIQQSLSAQLPYATFEKEDPDELGIGGRPTGTGGAGDLSVWRVVLAEPYLTHACVRLRITITGQFREKGKGRATFVLCGTPVGGGLLVKAIWQVGSDEYMENVYRSAPWRGEPALLEAFELYFKHRTSSTTNGNVCPAARNALNFFLSKHGHLFLTHREQRWAEWLTRHWVELPDERGPAAFLRRCGLPLVVAIALFIVVPFLYRTSMPYAILCLIGGGYWLWSALRIAWQKLRQVRRYRTKMRLGLGKFYAGQIVCEEFDLSRDKTATLLKCAGEVEAMGALHVCDFRIKTANSVDAGTCVYRLGDTTCKIALLYKSNEYLYFPPKPVLMATTRFEDGRRHSTINTRRARKSTRREVTTRCMLTDGGIVELLGMHRRHVDKLVSGGAVPVMPSATASQVIERIHREHEENRKAWELSPYSWGDALHDAFKICRRECLKD